MAGAFREEANADKIYNHFIDSGIQSETYIKNKHGLPMVYGSY
jgi:hypothetical protein